jgi:cardiolipin synthase
LPRIGYAAPFAEQGPGPLIRQDAEILGWIWGTVRADLVAIVGVPLAIMVTIHVLLRKRDVAASIGWIGLAWLTPIIGAGLYFLFGIGRVTRRARQVRAGTQAGFGKQAAPPPSIAPHFVPLDCAVHRITGDALEGGTEIAMLRNGDEAYPAMLAAIAEATTTIGLSTYIMRADKIGEAFVEALAGAMQRGVDVRVLVDGIGSGYFLPAAYGRLHRKGVPVGRFMHSPLPWRMPFLNLRTHKKVLVVDGCVAFVGGMNIGDEDLPSRRPRDPVLDTHFRIVGSVARQIAADFVQDWAFVTGRETDDRAWFPPVAEAGSAASRAVPSGPDRDIEKIEFVMLQAFACARSSIRLMTPYFLPSEVLLTSIAMAAMRGVAVDIVVPAQSNHRYVDWAVRAHIGPLLDNGVRIWQNPPPFDHSKLLVVDDEWCFVGSANMDMRSLRLNFELNVEVYDKELAARLNSFMSARQVNLITQEELARRGLLTRLRDAGVRLAMPYL